MTVISRTSKATETQETALIIDVQLKQLPRNREYLCKSIRENSNRVPVNLLKSENVNTVKDQENMIKD